MAAMGATVLVVSGVAYALSVQCDSTGDQDPELGECAGTNLSDVITGTAQRDIISALGGRDVVSARGGTILSTAAGAGTTSGANSAETAWTAVGAPTTSTVARVRAPLSRHPFSPTPTLSTAH